MNEIEYDVVQDGGVNTDALMAEIKSSIEGFSDWNYRCVMAEDTCDCLWPGQTDDGLKHALSEDHRVFPWENASDTRVRMAETALHEATRLASLATRRGRWTFTPTEGMDYKVARRNAQLLKWQEATQIPQASRERDMWFFWSWLYGLSVMGIGWERREELGLRRFSVQTVMQMLEQQMQVDPNTVTEANDFAWSLQVIPESDPDAETQNAMRVDWLRNRIARHFPEASAKHCRKAALALREGEEAHLPEMRTVANHPVWQAMMPGDDVYFPCDTDNIGTAAWVAVRGWFSKVEIRAKQASGEWASDFCDKLLLACGKDSMLSTMASRYSQNDRIRKWASQGSPFRRSRNTDDACEVFTIYHRASDDGVPCTYCTIMSPFVTTGDRRNGSYLVAKQELYDTGTGKMPFEALTYFDSHRALLDCNGIPARIHTHQNEKKAMRDSRIDATSLAIMPPFRRHASDRSLPLLLAPNTPIYESVRGSFEWMRPPENRTGQAIDLEQSVQIEVDRLCGCENPAIPATVTQMAREYLASRAVEAYGRVLTHTFQLNQLYLDEVTVMRVTAAIGEPFKTSREEIQGQFDFRITFDPRDLDMETAKEKFAMVARIVTELDTSGLTDRAALLEIGLSMVDPVLAQVLLTDGRQATDREVAETKQDIALIMSGQEPSYTPKINASVRMQTFQQSLQSPVIQQLAQANEVIGALLENYGKYLQFQIDQQTINPQIGRSGVKPQMPKLAGATQY